MTILSISIAFITSTGFMVAVVVLSLLIGLLYAFGIIGKKEAEGDGNAPEGGKREDLKKISDNESAAIAMALRLYYDDVHDEESYVITLVNNNNRYSPWNSKIYGIQ